MANDDAQYQDHLGKKVVLEQEGIPLDGTIKQVLIDGKDRDVVLVATDAGDIYEKLGNLDFTSDDGKDPKAGEVVTEPAVERAGKPPEPAGPKSALTDEDRREISLQIMTKTTAVLNPVEYAQMKKLAQEFYDSGALAKSFENVQQVIMALAAGREMGMGFTESINGLYFIDGKLNVYGKATPAALRRNGWSIKYIDETADSCTAVLKNAQTGEEIQDTFTYQDAEQSGFTTYKDKYTHKQVDKLGWRPGANRKRKLRYGVLSLIIHTYIPEVLGPVQGIGEYSQDYLDAEADRKPEPIKVDSNVTKAATADVLANLDNTETVEGNDPHAANVNNVAPTVAAGAAAK